MPALAAGSSQISSLIWLCDCLCWWFKWDKGRFWVLAHDYPYFWLLACLQEWLGPWLVLSQTMPSYKLGASMASLQFAICINPAGSMEKAILFWGGKNLAVCMQAMPCHLPWHIKNKSYSALFSGTDVACLFPPTCKSYLPLRLTKLCPFKNNYKVILFQRQRWWR